MQALPRSAAARHSCPIRSKRKRTAHVLNLMTREAAGDPNMGCIHACLKHEPSELEAEQNPSEPMS